MRSRPQPATKLAARAATLLDRTLALGLVALAVAMPGCHRAPSDPMTDERFAKLTASFQEDLDDLRKKAGFPGAVAALEWSDGRTAVVATGVADRESGVAMPKDARLLAGSVGKSFVGAVALGLAKEEKLTLDAKIETWFGTEPWFEKLPNARDVTLRMLLTHSSGLPDHIYEPEFVAAIKAARSSPTYTPDWFVTPAEAVGMIVGKPARFEAGKGFAYSDTNYILAGLVIEKVAGRPYYDELRARFLEPLGLTATVPADTRTIPGLVPGYVKKDNPLGLAPKTMDGGSLVFSPASEWCGGGLASNPADLVKWAKVLYEGKAMTTPYLEDLLTSVEWTGVPGARYGLGVIVRESPLGTHYGHSGWFPGYVTRVLYFPKEKVAVALQINTDDGQDVTAHALALAKVVLKG
jgi:D-alanyl-D-alanine carboxypeptidase